VPTAAALLCAATRSLRAAGIEAPRAEARLLLREATGWTPERLLAEPLAAVPETATRRMARLVEARAARTPMAYVLGEREFWSLAISVGPGALVPRPETETLVEAAIEALPDRDRGLRILDLGTGSGCLLVALLRTYRRATGVGTDRSAAALGWARANLARHRLLDRALLLRTDWAAGLAGRFELIVANPPYVASAELARLEPEVARHEPVEALDGGPDGLGAYRALLPDLARLLAPGGLACLEIGAGQEPALRRLCAEAGLAVAVRPDLAGIARCLVLRGEPGAGSVTAR
jgi:release factor glutamine methyltransferase